MASNINDITINYEEDGIKIVNEIDKKILSKGVWTTIMFRYKQWEKAKNTYSDDKFTIRRYKKINGEYIPQSKFNISSTEQAKKIIETLTEWIEC